MLSNLCHWITPEQFVHKIQVQAVCNALPRQTINANGPSDELGYQTFSGVQETSISYCMSRLTEEHQGVGPQEDVPESPRKKIFKSHHHHCADCFQAGCRVLEGLVLTGLPDLFVAIWVENQGGQLNTYTYTNLCLLSGEWINVKFSQLLLKSLFIFPLSWSNCSNLES